MFKLFAFWRQRQGHLTWPRFALRGGRVHVYAAGACEVLEMRRDCVPIVSLSIKKSWFRVYWIIQSGWYWKSNPHWNPWNNWAHRTEHHSYQVQLFLLTHRYWKKFWNWVNIWSRLCLMCLISSPKTCSRHCKGRY
jgi:hypothetical protein